MNARGQYGSSRVGQSLPQATTVYVAREPSSIGTWILGTLAVGGAVLWARHQTRQIEQLYKTAGLPQQSFASSLRQGAASSLQGASSSLHAVAERVRPKRLP
jgi:hypothetical protein